jgi:AraC-like DNA-binding protein
MSTIKRIETITEVFSFFGTGKPKHPLVSLVKHDDIVPRKSLVGESVVIDLYQVTFKMCSDGSFGYGRNSYDFQEGTMIFTRPGQVITMHDWEPEQTNGGWTLMFHPDLLRKSELGRNIDNYTFFSYDVNEALHLSDDEKKTLLDIANKIETEYSLNIDKHSQKLIISNIELMLDYCMRYYDRQFYTRENINRDIVTKFETLLKDYYDNGKATESGLPTVKYCGEELNMSSNYLSDLLKKITGRNAQEHIHYFVIEKAKNLLLSVNDTVSSIAYDLGFEYPQHFSKIFKKKTGMSPAEYRRVS